jgi:hypothetical protein
LPHCAQNNWQREAVMPAIEATIETVKENVLAVHGL